MALSEAINHIFRVKGKYEQLFFKSFFNTFDFEDDLTHTHVIAMIILELDGPSRMSYISERLNLEKGSFTPVACRLIDLGYVIKVRDENDKRAYILRLTDKGQAFSQKFRAQHQVYIKGLLEQFNEADQQSFIRTIAELHRLIDVLEV